MGALCLGRKQSIVALSFQDGATSQAQRVALALRSQDGSINKSNSPLASCGGQILCAGKRLTLVHREGFNCRQQLAK